MGGQIDGQMHFYKTPPAGSLVRLPQGAASPRPATAERVAA
jgi:hypothetical protein